MQGKILSTQLISGDDGKRYEYDKNDVVNLDGKDLAVLTGSQVDFVSFDDRVAKSIYIINENVNVSGILSADSISSARAKALWGIGLLIFSFIPVIGLQFFIFCLKGNCQCCSTLRNVGGRCQRQPVGAAKFLNLSEVNDGVHVMDAGNNRRCIQCTHNQRTNAEGQRNQCLNTVNDAGFHEVEYRGDDRQGQESGNEYRYKRGNEQVKHCRNMLVQELFNLAHHEYCNDN